ncbi:hypothetical protein HDU93_004146 [Gonapodya sp. JEL0774]|nr:hypothetical protein HDU93_004146 [Gonapodya sp. JEL0774]
MAQHNVTSGDHLGHSRRTVDCMDRDVSVPRKHFVEEGHGSAKAMRNACLAQLPQPEYQSRDRSLKDWMEFRGLTLARVMPTEVCEVLRGEKSGNMSMLSSAAELAQETPSTSEHGRETEVTPGSNATSNFLCEPTKNLRKAELQQVRILQNVTPANRVMALERPKSSFKKQRSRHLKTLMTKFLERHPAKVTTTISPSNTGDDESAPLAVESKRVTAEGRTFYSIRWASGQLTELPLDSLPLSVTKPHGPLWKFERPSMLERSAKFPTLASTCIAARSRAQKTLQKLTEGGKVKVKLMFANAKAKIKGMKNRRADIKVVKAPGIGAEE